MKVRLSGRTMGALTHQLVEEGEELVNEGEELLLTDTLTKGLSTVVGGDCTFPRVVVEAMGFEPSLAPRQVCVMRWFDQGWRPQVILGFPLLTHMPHDLGAPCECGIACRYIHGGPLVELFDSPMLASTLREMKYIGLVTISTTIEGDVTQVQTGAPCYALFNVLEGIRGRTVEFFTGETPALMESWTVGLVLSRFPWPFVTPMPPVQVNGIMPAIEKHLWLLDTTSYKRAYTCDGPVVGVATAWSQTLSEATRRVMRTLDAVECPGRQYRTDVVTSVGERMRALVDRGWVS